jgi:nucleoside-diphosphate-sugar epimerase
MKKNIKYTVFGHNGFLGTNIVKYLKKKNYDIFLPPRNKIKFTRNLNNVIYCIGSDDVLRDPINAIESNLMILCKIILNNKFKSFIYISSTRLYLNSKKTNENDSIKIDTNSSNYFYNSLKAAAETFCLSQKNKNIKVVRLSNLYGLNFKDQIYLLPSLIRNSKINKKINIYINKESKKNYININDVIDIIIKITNKSKYRLYNIASDKRLAIKKIASIVKKVTDCKIAYSNQKEKVNEPIIDITRIKKEFKFKPINNFNDFIPDIIKKYKW